MAVTYNPNARDGYGERLHTHEERLLRIEDTLRFVAEAGDGPMELLFRQVWNGELTVDEALARVNNE